MKKTFKFFAAALAIVAAASCAKELANDDATQTPEADQELVHKVFSASLNVDPETKTTLHTDGVTVHWTEGDKIKVIPANAYKGNDFNVVSIEGTFADFEGETVDADSHRAVYPAAAYYTNWSYASYCVFSDGSAALKTQYAVENNFSLSSFNTSSNFAVSSTSKENHLYFKNINAYFKLSLSMDNAASIEISSDKAEGSGGLSTSYDLGGTLNYRYAENKAYLSSDHSIVFKTKDNSNLKSGVTYYIAVPAVQVEGLKFTVKDANGTEITSFTKSSFTFEQNKIYNLGTIEIKPHVGDYYYSDGTFGAQYKSNAVGVIFYVGDPHQVDSTIPSEYKNGLVVGLEEIANVAFDSGPSLKGTSKFQPDYHYSNINTSITSNYGYTSTALALIDRSKAYEMTDLHKSNNTSLYQSYNLSNRTKYASNWYIPSCKEYSLMYKSMSVLNAKDNFTDLRSWGASDKSIVFSKLNDSPCFGYHTVWQANLENGWRCINYYYLSDSNEEGIYPTVVRQPNSNHGYPHIGRVIFAF